MLYVFVSLGLKALFGAKTRSSLTEARVSSAPKAIVCFRPNAHTKYPEPEVMVGAMASSMPLTSLPPETVAGLHCLGEQLPQEEAGHPSRH